MFIMRVFFNFNIVGLIESIESLVNFVFHTQAHSVYCYLCRNAIRTPHLPEVWGYWAYVKHLYIFSNAIHTLYARALIPATSVCQLRD